MLRIILMFITNFYKLPYLFYRFFKLSHTQKHDRFERYAFLHRFTPGANKGGRIKVVCTGLENLPKEDGYIIFPNHQGMFDVMSLIEMIDRPFSVVTKKETRKVPLLGRLMRILDAEFIDREDIRQSLTIINNVAERVKNGENFVIFAEGTRSKNGNEIGPFKGGTFKSATMAKCPIVPIALIDCFLPFDRRSLKKVTVYVHVFKPLCYEDYKDMKSTQIAELVHDTIRDYIHEELAKRESEPKA